MFSHSPPCHPIPTNKNPTQEELPEDVQHRSSDDLDEAKWSSNQPRKANNTYGRVWNLSSRLRYVQRFKGQYSLGLFLMFKYLDLLGLVKVSHHWRVAKVVGFLWLHFFKVRSPEEPPSWLKIHVAPKTVGFTLRPRHNFLEIDGRGFRIPNVCGGKTPGWAVAYALCGPFRYDGPVAGRPILTGLPESGANHPFNRRRWKISNELIYIFCLDMFHYW